MKTIRPPLFPSFKTTVFLASTACLAVQPLAAQNVWTGTSADFLWATGGNWSGAAEPIATDDVQFNGASIGTITLTAGDLANSLLFADDGYILSGGDLTLTNGNITVDPTFTATLATNLTGSAAINKLGTGTLIINTTSAATGGWNINQGTLQVGNVSIGSATASTITVAAGATLRTTAGSNSITDTSTLVVDGTWEFNNNNATAETIGTIGGAGSITRSDTGNNNTRTINLNSGTFDGIISDGDADTLLAINKNNAATTLTLTNTQTFTGALTASAGILRIAGNNARILTNQLTAASSDAVIEIGSHTDTAFNLDRIPDAGQIEIQDAGEVVIFGANDTVNTTVETIGSLETNSGHNVFTLNPVAGGQLEVTTGSLIRSNKGTLLFRGTGLGLAAAADTSRLFVTAAPTGTSFVGGGGAAGSTNISIIPWAIGNGTSTTGSGESFVTLDPTTGIRPLTLSEYATTIPNGSITDNNVRLVGAESVAYRSGVNALRMDTGSSLTIENGRVFEITSGAFLDNSAAGVTLSGGTLEFGTAEAIFYLAGASPATPITTTITSSLRNTGANAGLTLTASNNDSELVLAGASAITGEISINRGILRLDSDQALNPFSRNDIRFAAQGNTATARLRLNETDVYMGAVLAQNYGFVSNGGTLDATFAVNQTADRDANIVLEDGIGTGKLNLLKTGGSRLSFLADSTFTGTATVQAGRLDIRGGADWDSVSGVIIEGGIFAIYNTSGGSTNTNRLPDGMAVTFRGGEFQFDDGNSTNTNYSERVGAMVLESGVNLVSNDYQTSGSNTSVLYFNQGNSFANSLTRVPGAVVRFRAIDGALGVNTKGRIQIGPSNATNPATQLLKNGILAEGGVGGFGVVGDDWATISGDLIAGGNFDTSVTALTTYETSANPADWAAVENVRVSTPGTVSLTSASTINSLILDDQVDLDLGGNLLELDAGGVMALTTTTAKVISNGTLTGGAFAGSEIVLRTGNDANAGSPVTISAGIVDNGTNATSFTKWGAPDLILSGSNSFTGSLNITQGTVVAGGVGNLGVATTGRTLRMASGTTLDLGSSAASETLPFDTILATGIGTGVLTGPSGQTTTFSGTIGGHGDLRFNNTWDVTLTGAMDLRDGLTFGGNDAQIPTSNSVSTITLFGGDNEVGGALRIGLNQREAEVTQSSGTLRIGFDQFQPNLDIGVNDSSTTLLATPTRGLLDLTGTTNFETQVQNIRLGVSTVGSATGEGDLIIGQNSNLLVGNEILVGDSPTPGQSGVTSSLVFGSGTNTVRVPTFVVGGRKSTGEVTIAAGGTLNLNGVTGATVNLQVGHQRNTDTGTVASGTFDMTGGTLVARIESLEVGVKNRTTGNGSAGGANGVFTTGSSAANDISAISVLLGQMQRGTGTSTANSIGRGTLNMGGGVFDVFGDVTMGDWSDNSGTNGTARGDLNLTGGVFTVAGDIVKTDDDRSAANILLDGGTLDMQHQASGDLTMGTVTASRLEWRSGSIVDTAGITLDGREVTSGIAFDNLDHALVLRDVTASVPFTFSNVNDYKGGIQYDATGAGAGAIISGTVDLGSNIRLVDVQDSAAAANDLTISGDISGATGLAKTGAGNLLISGSANSYSGDTEIREGRLIAAGGNDRLPTTTSVILGDAGNSGVLQVGDSSGAISQQLAGLGTSGVGTDNAVVGGNSSNSTLVVNTAGAQTFGGQIGGTGTNENNLNLSATGTGAFTVSGPATYTGTTSVSGGGTLELAGGLDGTTVLEATGFGSVLRVSGDFAGDSLVTDVNIADGATLNLLNGQGDKLDMLTSLTLGSSGGTMSFLNFNVGDQTSPNDELNTDFLALLTGGTLNLFSGNQITFNLTDTGLNPNTTYDLLSFVDGGLTTGVLGVTDWILGGTPGGFTSANLIVTDTLIQFQTGLLVTGDWYWNAGGTPSQWGDAANWWDDKSGGATGAVRATTPGQGSDVIFIADNITGGGAITTTLDQNFKINSLTFEASTTPADTPVSVTIDPGAISTARLEVAPQVATDGVRITSGGPDTVTINSRFRVGADQAWDVDSGSSLIFTNSISGAGNVTINGDGASSGTVILQGMDGVADFTGTTTIADGTVILEGGASNRLPTAGSLILGSGATSGRLQVGDATNGASDTAIGDLATSGAGTANAIVGGNAAVSTLTINQTGNTTYAGALGGAGLNENNLALVKDGVGTLILDGASTYTGNTLVQQGTLQLGVNGSFAPTGSLNVIAGPGATAIFDLNGRTYSPSGDLVLGGADTGATPQIIDSNGTPGLITLGGNIVYDETNHPLGGIISANLANGAANRVITVGDSASAVIDLTLAGDYTSATDNNLTLVGAGSTLISGAVTLNTASTNTANDFIHNSTGETTLTGSIEIGDDFDHNSGTLTISGSGFVSQDDYIMDGAASVLNLNTASAIRGATNGSSADNRIYVRTSSTVNIGANDAIDPSLERIMLSDNSGGTSTLNLGAYNVALTTLDVGGGAADRIGLVTGTTGVLTINGSAFLNNGTVSGILASSASGFVMDKNTAFDVTLSADNQLGTTDTRVREGNLILDFTTNNGAKIGAGDLRMGESNADSNPMLTLLGNASAASTQSLATINAYRGAGDIVLVSNGQSVTLDLTGNVTRSNDSTLNFNLPAMTQVNAGTTTNTADGIVGAWATVNDSQFATVSGGQIIGLTSTVGDDPAAWTAGQHVINTAGYSHTIDLCTPSIASLILDAAAPSSLTLSGDYTISSGGIMVTPNVGANASVIAGGTLLSGTGGELIIQQNNPNGLGTLEIASDRAGPLTKSGPGTLILSGTQTAAGALGINEGSVIVTGGDAVWDNSDVNLQATDPAAGGAAFEIAAGQSETIRRLIGGSAGAGSVIINAGSTLVVNQTDGDTTATERVDFGGAFFGTGTLVKEGIDSLGITWGDAASTFTGAVVINEGRIDIYGASGALRHATSYTINAGGELLARQEQTASEDRLSNTAPITLNNTAGTVLEAGRQGLYIYNENQNGTRSDNVGPINLGAGHNVIFANPNNTGTSTVADVVADTLNRGSEHATLLVKGLNLGLTTGRRGQIRFDTAGQTALNNQEVGGGTSGTNIGIIPWIIGDDASTSGNIGDTFVTHDVGANGLRPLNLTTEYINNNTAITGALTDNIRYTSTATLSGTPTAINSLALSSASAVTLTGPASSMEITSGAILASGAGSHVIDTFTGLTTGSGRDLIVYVTSAAGSLALNSPITSAVPLVKSGDGTLTLGAAGNAISSLYLNQGTVSIDDTDKIGSASLNFRGGRLLLDAAFADDLGGRTMDVGTGDGVINTSGAAFTATDLVRTGAGALTILGGSTQAGGTVTFTGAPASTATGATIVPHGTIILNSSSSDPLGSGDFEIGYNTTTTQSAALRTLTDEQIGDNAHVKIGSLGGGTAGTASLGEFQLNGNTETIGSLEMRTLTGFGVATSTGAGGTLVVNGNITLDSDRGTGTGQDVRHVLITGTGTVASPAPDSGTLDLGGASRTVTVSTTNTTPITSGDVNGATIETTVINGGIIKEGNATLALTGTNTYADGTQINAGTVRISSAGNLGADTAGNGITLRDGGVLESTGALVTLGANRAVMIDGTGGELSVSGAPTNALLLDALVSGHECAPLTKSGVGALSLSQANTYAGGTQLDEGSLFVTNTSGSATGTGSVTTQASTILGGSGFIAPGTDQDILIGGEVIVGLPTDTAGEDLSMIVSGTGTITFDAGSTTTLDLWSGAGAGDNSSLLGAADRFILGGDIFLNGTLNVLDPNGMTAWAKGDTWRLFDWSGITNSIGSGNEFSTLSLPDISSYGLAWDTADIYVGGTITVVPEPGRLGLLALGLLSILRRRRQK